MYSVVWCVCVGGPVCVWWCVYCVVGCEDSGGGRGGDVCSVHGLCVCVCVCTMPVGGW